MKEINKFKVLKYIYDNFDIEVQNHKNNWMIRWITKDIPKKYLNIIWELDNIYLEYENPRNQWLWYYLTIKWMNYIEENKGFFWKIELYAISYPYLIWSLFFWMIWGFIANIIEKNI